MLLALFVVHQSPTAARFFAGPPPADYVCQPSGCIVIPPQPDYFNLDPEALDLSFGIFVKQVETIVVTGSNGQLITTQITTGD